MAARRLFAARRRRDEPETLLVSLRRLVRRLNPPISGTLESVEVVGRRGRMLSLGSGDPGGIC